MTTPASIATKSDERIVLPGLASAHSHAFQRAIRGWCQRRPESESGSFWSWRHQMYKLAAKLDPDSMYAIARFAYAELAMAGVTAVGEFHYVHHQADGTPYGTRTALADAVIAAATDVGIRISLLRVVYQRAGFQQPLEPAQRRFCDDSAERALKDIDALRTTYSQHPLVQVGAAIHSIRAVSRPWIQQISAYAKSADLPLHMHLSEQQRELDECIDEHGCPPVQVMAEDGILDANFVAVHATHVTAAEIQALGTAKAFVCLCRTTERDLGDGHCNSAALLAAGAKLCTGVDSHAISDPFEETRAIELDQRTRDNARTVVADATTLLHGTSSNGYAAIGWRGYQRADRVTLDATDASVVGAMEDKLDDAVVFAAQPRAIDTVSVAGDTIVRNGRHRDYEGIHRGFVACLQDLK